MRKLAALILLLSGVFVFSCVDTTSRSHGVYMLVDTSGTYTAELEKAQAIINYLLGTLQPGDTLAVARIDSGSFSEKDIIAKVTFDRRPSVSNKQKLAFRDKFNGFVAGARGSSHTDITGGMLQAVEYLNEAGAGRKHILIFSDLEEDLAKGHVRDIPFDLKGFNVVALNVTKLRSDNVDPRDYLNRLENWRVRVEEGRGNWRVINDLERLEKMLEG
jgi:hypothetical protein